MYFHTELVDRWNDMSIFQQMANIGAEVGRTIKWKKKGKTERSKQAMYRTLELIDFSVADPGNTSSLKEILRLREVFLDYVIGDNAYKSTEQSWDRYFYFFTIAARRESRKALDVTSEVK